MKIRSLIFTLMLSAVPAAVLADSDLRLPDGSTRGFEDLDPAATLNLPIGPFSDGKIDLLPVDGAVMREVWKTPGRPTDTHSVLEPLKAQLRAAGYEILYECAARDCGGYDFRFNTDVVEEPDMHVDIGDFRFLSAAKPVDGNTKYLSLLVSKSPDRGFVQVTTVGLIENIEVEFAISTKQSVAEDEAAPGLGLDLGAHLLETGAAVLEGLEFSKGASNLSGSPASALQELAFFLSENPAKTVVLVGHTDASGSLEGNVALSRKRAESVMERLIDTYGVDAERLSAEGVGYLAPRASNATKEGRERNRRVEAVLVSME